MSLIAYGTTDRCTGGTASASSGTAANAFDDNTGTYWQSTEANSWIKYDFGAGVIWKISKMTLLNYYAEAYGIHDFTVHGSNNDSEYTLLYTGEALGTAPLQTFNFTTNNTTAYRYIKITNVTGYYPDSTAIFEISLYEGIYSDAGFIYSLI